MKLFFGGCSMPSSSIRVLVNLFFILIKDQLIAKPQNHDSINPSGFPLTPEINGSNTVFNLENEHLDLKPPVPETPIEMPDLHTNTTPSDVHPTGSDHFSLPSLESSIVDSNEGLKPVESKNPAYLTKSSFIEEKPPVGDLVESNPQPTPESDEKNAENLNPLKNTGWSTPVVNTPKPTSPLDLVKEIRAPNIAKEGVPVNEQLFSDHQVETSPPSPFGRLSPEQDIQMARQFDHEDHNIQVDTQKNLQLDIKETINDIKSQLHDNPSLSTDEGSPTNENIIRHLNEKSHSNCSANEVYIIDGERTLLLTNKKLTSDIETMQDDRINLQRSIQNQNEIIFQLKQRLKNSEAQVDDSLGLLIKHEKSYQKLLRDLNETKSREGNMIIRNEVLQEEVANERKGREHYQQLSDHFKAEIDKANERLNGVMDVSKKQCDKTIHNLRSKYDQCKRVLNEKTRTIHGLYQEQTLIKDNLGVFNRTRVKYSKHRCRLIEQQLDAQDEALFLLKDQVKTQAHTLESMNRLISMKHDTIENIHNTVK